MSAASPAEPSPRLPFTSSLQASLVRATRLINCPIKLPGPYDISPPLFEKPLFDSAKKAVTFAVTREGNPARPESSRMLDKTSGSVNGTGLAGNDSAAQAGIIMSVIRRLGSLPTATLVASCSPACIRCECKRPCCGGKRLFVPWHESIATLADCAVLIPCRAPYPLRVALLVKIFGRRSLKLAEIAEALEIEQDSVERYHKIVVKWLKGARAGKNGEPAVSGIESEAWADAESLLRNRGIVG